MKSKRKIIFISVLIFFLLCIGTFFIKHIDAVYRRVYDFKQSISDRKNYERRHSDEEVLIENTEKPIVRDNDAWYTKYHFIAHSGGGVDGRVGTNSIQAWDYSYSSGNRVFDADLSYTSDGVLVLRHSWYDNLEDRDYAATLNNDEEWTEYIPTFDDFISTKLYYKYNPMSCKDMIDYMESHNDLFIIVDCKTDQRQAYQDLIDIAITNGQEDVLDRIIVSFYEYDDYEIIKEIYSFSNYVIRQFPGNEHAWHELINFCVKNDIPCVNIWSSFYKDEGVNLLADYGITPIVSVCDYISDMKVYKEQGFTMAVSNWLHEGDWEYVQR